MWRGFWKGKEKCQLGIAWCVALADEWARSTATTFPIICACPCTVSHTHTHTERVHSGPSNKGDSAEIGIDMWCIEKKNFEADTLGRSLLWL